MARAMVRLEEAGYVRRETNPQNKRENRIYVTHKGQLLVDRIQAMKNQWRNILLEGFTPEEREAFLALSARRRKTPAAIWAGSTGNDRFL